MSNVSQTTVQSKSEKNDESFVGESQTIITLTPESKIDPEIEGENEPKVSNTPRPATPKRGRPEEVATISKSQGNDPPRFQKSCSKCKQIRSSMNRDIAKLRKLNSDSSRDAKQQENVIKVLKKEKEQLQNSVVFLQNLCSSLDAEKKELKSRGDKLAFKVSNLKRVLNN